MRLPQAPQNTAASPSRAPLLHAARWEFADAVHHGEAALSALPSDGWVRNRLVHSALLGLDLERAGRHLGDLARLEAAANRLRGKSANPSQSHYGQIFDEFRLDGDVVAALRAVAENDRQTSGRTRWRPSCGNTPTTPRRRSASSSSIASRVD